ncbi:hypothetical protein KUCAC02_016491 [Chaenocephalus aceratus]|nr:hypothetical protein KUCAC02_016491 [Chaenocephalus aceratus]
MRVCGPALGRPCVSAGQATLVGPGSAAAQQKQPLKQSLHTESSTEPFSASTVTPKQTHSLSADLVLGGGGGGTMGVLLQK